MELTERSSQLDLLERRLAGLLRGDAAPTDRPVTVLTGPVGSGKTALAQTFARRACDAGARVVGASASRAERSVPLEVLRQLVRAVPLCAADAPDIRTRLASLLDAGALAWNDADPADAENARLTAAIGRALLELTSRGPLVIVVDDIHHADAPSLRCLDYVARRLPGLPVLIVLTEAPRTRPWRADVHAEMLQPARLHRIRLPLLTAEGTFQLLAQRLDIPLASSIAEASHRISGGNPLLVHALADDQAAAPRSADAPAVGESFREAVLSCLYRCDHLVLNAARVLAVTGEPLHGSLLPHLVDARSHPALGAVDKSTSAGLIDEQGLRHPAVTQAVIDGMTAEERVRLHLGAARLLHDDGAPPARIAPHLVGISELAEPWMAQTLLDAGEQALLDGEVETALRYLRRAHRSGVGECLRARIRSALARAEWRLDPQATIPHLVSVATAIRAGHLGSQQAAGPIQYLLWHGEIDKAVDLVRHLSERTDAADPQSMAELLIITGWISTLYPGVVVNRPAPAVAARNPLTLARVKHGLSGVILLSGVLARGDAGVVEEAERTLSTTGPDDEPHMFRVICALIAMIYADQLDLADDWCDRLGRHLATPHPTPSATLTALRAAVAGRLGDLPRAGKLADEALGQLSPKGWGVVIGIPLAVRIRALTLMDQLDTAAACLQVPVPPATFETPLGLHYLHARGTHALAAGSPEAALADFQLCGQLMQRWQLDFSGLVPWRTESARALLRMGRRQQARKLVRDELTRLRPLHVRYRAAALRVLAATEEGQERIPHLRSAVRLLRQCGDRMELAHNLADLGHAYEQAGDRRQARAAIRSARSLAEECGIPTPWPGALSARDGATGRRTGAAVVVQGLTDTESRMAILAAQGHTNREMAEKLFLTVSAIEQRMTRIYRKLDVNSRSELAGRLRFDRPGTTVLDPLTRGTDPPGGRPSGPRSR